MAERRMFAKTIVDSDAFLEMPVSSQLLYFHLSMRADDEGFINNPKSIMRTVGSKDDDMNMLIVKKFIIPFESGVVVIKHWKIHNYIQSDRFIATKYNEEKSMLELDENKAYRVCKNDMDTECIQDVYNLDTQVSIGKVSIGKDIVSKDKKGRFTPPTLQEVEVYAQERNRLDLAKTFFEFYNAGDWFDSKGNKVKNWKQKFITWEKSNYETKQRIETPMNYVQDDVQLSQEEIDTLKNSLRNIGNI